MSTRSGRASVGFDHSALQRAAILRRIPPAHRRQARCFASPTSCASSTRSSVEMARRSSTTAARLVLRIRCGCPMPSASELSITVSAWLRSAVSPQDEIMRARDRSDVLDLDHRLHLDRGDCRTASGDGAHQEEVRSCRPPGADSASALRAGRRGHSDRLCRRPASSGSGRRRMVSRAPETGGRLVAFLGKSDSEIGFALVVIGQLYDSLRLPRAVRGLSSPIRSLPECGR